MRKIKFLFLFLLLFISPLAHAQVRSFNADPTIFMQELESLFKGVEDKETLKDFAVFKDMEYAQLQTQGHAHVHHH